MKKYAVAAILLTALVLPIVLFLLLIAHFYLNDLVAAGIAVAVGWASNVVWALSAQGAIAKDLSQSGNNTLRIAMRFGWICPIALVLLTWLFWRFAA